MKELFDKISTYNIFNYLLPGILFVVFCKYFIGYTFILEDDFLGAFLYYFIGMVISRFGSLIVEPFLKWINFLKFEDYKKYIIASQKDHKIELFSEISNTYRTITSLFVLLILVKIYYSFDIKYNFANPIAYTTITIILLFLFLLSYRKQTNYISKRIKSNS